MATKRHKIKLIRKIFSISLSFIMLGSIGFYFWQIIDSMSQKYQIQNLENGIKDLKTANQQLKIDVAALQSISRVQNFALESGMSQVPSIVYLSINASEVAVKK